MLKYVNEIKKNGPWVHDWPSNHAGSASILGFSFYQFPEWMSHRDSNMKMQSDAAKRIYQNHAELS